LHWNEKYQRTGGLIAFHYTKGKGYYENYKENGKFSDYGLTPIVPVTALQSTEQI
jgi:iron complex outermembrane receptor protein